MLFKGLPPLAKKKGEEETEDSEDIPETFTQEYVETTQKFLKRRKDILGSFQDRMHLIGVEEMK